MEKKLPQRNEYAQGLERTPEFLEARSRQLFAAGREYRTSDSSNVVTTATTE